MYKALNLWLPAYLRRAQRPPAAGVTDVMLAVCDHFEPLHGADQTVALQRLQRWQREFVPLIEPFRDSDGIRPRHTFFYPVEQYDPEIVGELARLCQLCGGETELHLHHDGDNAARLRTKLEQGKADLARHGLLARDGNGAVRFGFIHGDWALANSHPHGRNCGVDEELTVLAQAGCYADFTMPAAPDPAQSRVINRIYYATSNGRPRSHDDGIPSAVGLPPTTRDAALLLVQGPLGLNWSRKKFGLFPRIENGEITGANPPTLERMKIWMDLGVHVRGRPEWVFIKLHTHAGSERDMATVLTDRMSAFFRNALAEFNDGRRYRLHFVSAREMVNIIHAAEDGKSGNPGEFRDYRYFRPKSG